MLAATERGGVGLEAYPVGRIGLEGDHTPEAPCALLDERAHGVAVIASSIDEHFVIAQRDQVSGEVDGGRSVARKTVGVEVQTSAELRDELPTRGRVGEHREGLSDGVGLGQRARGQIDRVVWKEAHGVRPVEFTDAGDVEAAAGA